MGQVFRCHRGRNKACSGYDDFVRGIPEHLRQGGRRIHRAVIAQILHGEYAGQGGDDALREVVGGERSVPPCRRIRQRW